MKASPCEIYLASSNKGKFRILSDYLSPEFLLKQPSPYTPVAESDSIRENAANKAKESSRMAKGIFLANDDSLIIKTHLANQQPITAIYRNIPVVKQESDIVSYYFDQFRKFGLEQFQVEITGAYALAILGRIIDETIISYEIVFKLPPTKIFEPGMPLSAFHFIPHLGKYFVDLTHFEKKTVIDTQLGTLKRFIMEALYSSNDLQEKSIK